MRQLKGIHKANGTHWKAEARACSSALVMAHTICDTLTAPQLLRRAAACAPAR
jgi:hypothetical protein